MSSRRPLGRGLALLLALLGAGAASSAALGQSTSDGPPEVGPSSGLTGNGRLLRPDGRLSTVGDFPTGAAVSPDGRSLWVADAGHGRDDVQIVDLASGSVRQVLPLPGASGGVAFAPDGRTAYVSGEPKGDSKPSGPTVGDGGDVVHVFAVDPGSGHAAEQAPITLPRLTGGQAQDHASPLPPLIPGPTAGSGLDWPEGMAATPDGRWLVVALNQADQAAVIDLRSRSVRTVHTDDYPNGVAIGRDGRTAYVTNELNGTVSVIDVPGAQRTGTITGLGGPAGDAESHPEGIVADPTRDRLYVAVASRDLVDVIDTANRAVIDRISVAPPAGLGAQPVALALSPDGRTLYSADSGEDAVAAISVVARGPDVRHPVVLVRGAATVARYLHRLAALRHRAGLSARARRRALASLRHRLLVGPTMLACGGPTRPQERAYVRRVTAILRTRLSRRVRRRRLAAARAALPAVRGCGEDIPGLGADRLIGKLPTAAYPSAVAATPDGRRLAWVAAKGLGAGPNPDYGSHFANSDVAPYGSYVPDKLLGRVGVLARPSDMAMRAQSAAAAAQTLPANAQSPPADTPVQGPGAGASAQIKHVFYIVRENRTYDQIFGTDPRGDGDPSLELFDGNSAGTPAGGVTPNAHSLVRRFPLLDQVFADSEVSVDGHQITAGGTAIDYVQKALHPNYSDRGRIDEFGQYPITLPPHDYLFDQAARQGVSFRNYGESSAGTASTDNDGRPTYQPVVDNTVLGYPFFFGCGVAVAGGLPNALTCDTDSGTLTGPGDPVHSRFDFFKADFARELAAGSVPALSYLTLPNDHTNGVQTGYPTPRALVADNDQGLGQLVDLISHSPIWSSSAIFVVEDDSQDGADHVDAHRMPAFVVSPWTRDGAVIHTRYDQDSVLHTIELMLGLKPLGLADAEATPLYDAFRPSGQAPDLAPYDVVTPTQDIRQVTTAAQARRAGALTAQLPFARTDVVPQALFDRVLWHSVYGPASIPPPPGPGASPLEAARASAARAVFARGGDVRRWLLSHTQAPPHGRD